MGGFFGAVKKKSAILDVFFGTDYHSHLGTVSAGIASYSKESGITRKIHNIENAPFRTKFGEIIGHMDGTSALGCINDTDPQPLVVTSRLGTYAICFVGVINNANELVLESVEKFGQMTAMSHGGVNTTELLAALINSKKSFEEGIDYAWQKIQGTASILILKENGNLIAARDKLGRLPVNIGKNKDGFCVSFESFACEKLDYQEDYSLGAAEIVEISPSGYTVLKKAEDKLKICSFLWSYYGFPTSKYEGKNVEIMRCKNGEIMANNDKKAGILPDADYVAGVPDSGTPHAIGYANASHISFARPFIKYTPTWPRSFMPAAQKMRNTVAKMKQIPICELIEGKELLFVDDSIVRGTQIRETVEFLYENGAKKVHMRSACPPIMYGCKYLNFSRSTSDMELITRATILELEGEEGFKYIDEYSSSETERGKKMRKAICGKLHLGSLEFQSLSGLVESIGIDKCKLCTYCWNGKE
ncbi:MAG: amidophosphoribosyltransferase [Firmicutes bacterium]|nr:amidophosphoribosyltransferase [Bacillota bacterium]